MDLVRIAAGAALVLAGAAEAAAAGGQDDPHREICRSKPVVGSRLKRIRECHSAGEWEDMKRAERLGLTSRQFNGADGQGANEYVVRGGSEAPH
jgi:hypothetical protein